MPSADFSPDRYYRRLPSFLLFAAAVIVSGLLSGFSFTDLAHAVSKGLALAPLFFPPEWSALPEMLRPAAVTVVMSLVATPMGSLLAVFFGLAGARNIAPAWLRLPARSFIAIERGILEVVSALILVSAFGLGPAAGVMGLAIGSIGMLGKLMADAIEEIDQRTLDAVAAVGATRWQVVRHAVLPEVLPSLVSNSIFRFEWNIRAAMVLGAVGAGGIGYELQFSISQLEYSRATVAALVSVLIVILSERVSDRVRSTILNTARQA